jgi:hypothetical protein
MRDDRERLLDMLEAIRKIEQITSSEKGVAKSWVKLGYEMSKMRK